MTVVMAPVPQDCLIPLRENLKGLRLAPFDMPIATSHVPIKAGDVLTSRITLESFFCPKKKEARQPETIVPIAEAMEAPVDSDLQASGNTNAKKRRKST